METILNTHINKNVWDPYAIDEDAKIDEAFDSPFFSRSGFLYIFQTEPYIDSVYMKFDFPDNYYFSHRFIFHDGYVWKSREESFFQDFCLSADNCAYSGGVLDEIYQYYSKMHPEWHLKRYYTKGLRILDHIYHCMVGNTAKELLYKSDLDELAAGIDELDGINLLSKKPSDLYDGLSMRILRSINCKEGARLLTTERNRIFLKELNSKFPETFQSRLNDAQCKYLSFLINGELTVGETGRLFKARRRDLGAIWNNSLFDIFMINEKRKLGVEESIKKLSKIDPIYEDYFRNSKHVDTKKALQLDAYLLRNREEYDKKIRQSNRKREDEWQERNKGYVVRYPQTVNDFCRESIYQCNCLLTYLHAYFQNDTTILFMRKTDDVNRPFITLEIYDNTLMQAYHRFNTDCTVEEALWIERYCDRHGIETGKFKFNADVDELF